MLKILAFVFIAVFSLATFACDGGMFPKDFLSVPADATNKSTITEEQFLAIVKNFETKIGTWVEANFYDELIVFKSWQSNTVNAYAEHEDGKMMITVYGGIARHPSMTYDGFSLVLCHELGHHLGGYPKKTGNAWSSAEGQADYYATTKCLRRLWEHENNSESEIVLNAPEIVKNKCAETFKDKNEISLCARMSMAGKALANLFQALDHDSFEPLFETPDPKISPYMELMHPYSQCRLDTYFQGSLCHVNYTVELDEYDETKGACYKSAGDLLGIRPACWFKAKK